MFGPPLLSTRCVQRALRSGARSYALLPQVLKPLSETHVVAIAARAVIRASADTLQLIGFQFANFSDH
jgi:hypothetical protein